MPFCCAEGEPIGARLAQAVAEAEGCGKHPRALCLVPDIDNPTAQAIVGGALLAEDMSLARRITPAIDFHRPTRDAMLRALELGAPSPTPFAMLIIMTIVTTMATAPLVEWLGTCTRYELPYGPRAHARRPAAALFD